MLYLLKGVKKMSNKMKKKHLKQVQNQAQEGRSMVEMLGVLAIIGVISIGGIAGYRWGMDKHVSNQILYEMNLNSAQLAMLLQKGNPEGVTLSLGSPYDEGKFRTVDYGFAYACGEEASFGPDCQYLDETMYSMTATGLPKRVCNMLGDAVFGMAYYYDSEINGGDNECNDTGNTVTVFFDTDTTVEGGIPRPEESETHTPVPEVTEAITSTTTATESTTPETTTTEVTTEVTTTQATTATLTATIVTTTTFNGECRTNAECKQKYGDGYFCLSDDCYNYCECIPDGNGYCKQEEETITEEEACGKNKFWESSYGTYRCEKVDDYKAENKDSENPNTYVVSKDGKYMNWWSAERFCEAQNRRMMKISDFNCENKNLGGTTLGACCDSNGYQNDWSGSCKVGTSDIVKAVHKAAGGHYYWLQDPFTSINADRNSCRAYYIDPFSGVVDSDQRDEGGPVVCVE